MVYLLIWFVFGFVAYAVSYFLFSRFIKRAEKTQNNNFKKLLTVDRHTYPANRLVLLKPCLKNMGSYSEVSATKWILELLDEDGNVIENINGVYTVSIPVPNTYTFIGGNDAIASLSLYSIGSVVNSADVTLNTGSRTHINNS